MKDIIKFLSIITGLFRSIVTILFTLGIIFIILVDAELLVAFFDILGFTNISVAIIKPILITMLIIFFIISFIITRHVFIAGNTGRYHLSNFILAILFLAVDSLLYIFLLRKIEVPVMYVFFILNAILALNSLMGLIAKSRGVYDEPIILKESNNNSDYIKEDMDEDSKNEIIDNLKVREDKENIEVLEPVGLNFNDDLPKEEDITTNSEQISDRIIETSEEKLKDVSDKIIIESDLEDNKQDDIKNISSKNIRVAKKREISSKKNIPHNLKINEDNKDKRKVVIDKSITNNISYQNSNLKDNETYEDKYMDDIKKEKEERIFDKSEFIKENEDKKDED